MIPRENSKNKFFVHKLLDWHAAENNRQLPWKNEKDPYKIWLSEVILQQTRAEQALPYYLGFVEQYPDVQALASAPDENVFRLWQGLGYYNRCRNLLTTARFISKELGGVFPDSYEGILLLKGVGVYTAAAIASFAYGLPHAVVDGNVYRVLSRFFLIETPYDTTAGKREFARLADDMLPKEDSAAYNQAIMDLGATVCFPRKPDCVNCPVASKCEAARTGLQSTLPVKSKKITVKRRFFYYILFFCDGNLLLRKRTENDIWANLYEPYLAEITNGKDFDVQIILNQIVGKTNREVEAENCGFSTQRLTHQLIEAHFYSVRIFDEKINVGDGYEWVPLTKLSQYAFPKTILLFLKKNNIYKFY